MILQEGEGWRFARDSARESFSILIGGEHWAFELTLREWRELMTLVLELEQQHRLLVDQLMAEEAISIELERGPWWAALEGDRRQWGLAVVLTAVEGRSAEGAWPAPAAMALVAAMRIELDKLND